MPGQHVVNLHIFVHDGDPDPRVDQVLGTLQDIQTTLTAVQQKEDHMSQELDDLTASVAANKTVEQSAITLIQGLSAQITAAAGNPAALAALAADLNTQANDLATAVAAGTPAAP